MRKLDRYIIKSYLGPMVITLLIILFVLMLQFVWLRIDELVGKGLSLSVILEVLFWGTVQLFSLAMPLSTMLASIMTMGNLGENNELLAMKAAGISLQRIIRPLMILIVFVVCIGTFFIANNFVPYANLQIRVLLYDISKKRSEIKVPSGVFYDGIQDIALYVDKQDESGLMHGLMLYDHRDKKGNTSVTVAKSGRIRLTENKQHIMFSFYDGYTYEEGERKSTRDTTVPFQRRYFAEQEILVPLEGYDFQRSDGESFKDQARMLSIRTLSHREDSLRTLVKLTQEQFMQRMLGRSGYLPRYSEIDSTQRQQRIYTVSFDSLYAALPLERQQSIAEMAHSNIEQSVMYVQGYYSDHERIDAPRRLVEIEWYIKFMLSFACLVFFFIGAPLGAIIRKGGLGLPTVVSIFFFLVYWTVDMMGKKLARDDVWDPLFGTLLSTMVLLPIGIFLTYKATTDSSLFTANKYFAWLKKLFILVGPLIGYTIIVVEEEDDD